MPLWSTTSSRDNWERLVAAVLKKELYLQLCRLTSISTVASTTASSSFSEQIFNDSLKRVSASQFPRVSHNGGVVESMVSSQPDGWIYSDPVATDTPQSCNHGFTRDKSASSEVVYTWGRVTCDIVGKMKPDEASVLLPTPLQYNATLDVHHIDCGARHSALVTREGKVFTWGQGSGGAPEHEVEADVAQPRLLEPLSFVNVDSVSCGEFHSCAVSTDGGLYTWGDGLHNTGLLGHGTDHRHWMPERVMGPLDGFQVAKVACGPRHTALITSSGQLFTFGVGTWGALGHGNVQDVSYPRKVETLSEFTTVEVACGAWHTAAIIEDSSALPGGILFTWGDGAHYRLGHGDSKVKLRPTPVPSVVDFGFHQVSCGHSLTVGLTATGCVFTMGSSVHGQLGNPLFDGKLPCLVKGKLSGEYVKQISCGMFHVAVLTSRNEVYTWGNGMHGRLGHGDEDDRSLPTRVEGLRDVKYIACGTEYSVAVCRQKQVSVAKQSRCSVCRHAFGFIRKRHNCYNCGVVCCHACSSRKVIGAVMAPDPSKLCRVCVSCYGELAKDGLSRDMDKLSPSTWFDSDEEEE